MNYLLSALITLSVAGISYELSRDEVNLICQAATTRLTSIEQKRDAELLKGATTQWQLDGNAGKPTEQQLVDAQLLDPAYLTRERVAESLTDCSAK